MVTFVEVVNRNWCVWVKNKDGHCDTCNLLAAQIAFKFLIVSSSNIYWNLVYPILMGPKYFCINQILQAFSGTYE